jgi:hypothetical protein
MASIVSAGTTSATALNMSADTTGVLQLASNNGTVAVTVDTSQRTLIGLTTSNLNARAAQKLLVGFVGASNAGASLTQYSAGTTSHPVLDFNFSRGATENSMTVPQSGDRLGVIVFRGADTTQFADAALIAGETDGAAGVGDMPGRLVFYTTADGTSSGTERMRIDNAGRVTKPYQPGFRAGKSSVAATVATGAIFQFNSVSSGGKFNTGSNYNTTTGTFTCPIAGSYYFHSEVILEGVSNNTDLTDLLQITVNGTLVAYSEKRAWYVTNTTGSGAYYVDNISAVLYLSAGDAVRIVNGSAVTVTQHSNVNYGIFEGYLLG